MTGGGAPKVNILGEFFRRPSGISSNNAPLPSHARIAETGKDSRQETSDFTATHRDELLVPRRQATKQEPWRTQQIAEHSPRDERIASPEPRSVERPLTPSVPPIEARKI